MFKSFGILFLLLDSFKNIFPVCNFVCIKQNLQTELQTGLLWITFLFSCISRY